MLKNIWTAIQKGTRGALAEPLVLAAAFALYALMLGVVSLFVRTREATIIDLLITFVAPILVCALFFALQSLAVRPKSIDGSKRTLSSIIRDGWNLFVVSIPVIVLAVIIWMIVDRFTLTYEGSFSRRTLLPIFGMIVLYVILPLIAIRLWIAARSGVRSAYKSFGRSILNALNPSRLLVYTAFTFVFGGMAYLLIFKKTPVNREWVEVGLLTVRLALAAIVIFFGWFLGVRAVSELNSE